MILALTPFAFLLLFVTPTVSRVEVVRAERDVISDVRRQNRRYQDASIGNCALGRNGMNICLTEILARKARISRMGAPEDSVVFWGYIKTL